MFDDCFIIILHGAYEVSVRKVIEAHLQEEAQGCEQDHTTAHSGTVQGRMDQASTELSIQSCLS